MKKSGLSGLLLVVCLLAVVGCGDINIQIDPGMISVNGFGFSFTGETAERSLKAELRDGIQEIHVENQFGAVNINAAEPGQQNWSWTLKTWADTQPVAHKWIDKIDMKVESSGDKETWKLVTPKSGRDELNGMQSDLTINVPAGVEVVVSNEHGGCSVKNINGTVQVTNSHGDIELASLGANSNVTIAHGDFHATDVQGVGINSQHSTLQLAHTKEIEVSAQHGEFGAFDITGAATINGQHCDLKLESVTGAVELDSSHGDIVVQRVNSVKAKLSHSDIVINQTKTSAYIRGSHSDISIRLPAGAKPSVTAAAEYGDVRNAFSGSKGPAPSLDLKTNHGDITVERLKVMIPLFPKSDNATEQTP